MPSALMLLNTQVRPYNRATHNKHSCQTDSRFIESVNKLAAIVPPLCYCEYFYLQWSTKGL